MINNIEILREKLVIFIEFKNEILRTYALRMTAKGWLINIRRKLTSLVILSVSEESPTFIEFLA